jgi:hypothetical protein
MVMFTQSFAIDRWQSVSVELAALTMLLTISLAANAQEFGQGARRNLLSIETSDLAQGRLRIEGGERAMPPGGRSPWHTGSSSRLLYVVEGTIAVDGLGGETYATCGPAPKLCLTPNKSPFFFRNAGAGPLKFVVIGIDAVDHPTIHEEVGTVSAITGNRVSLVIGDFRKGDLATPRREVTLTVATVGSIAVGDDVMTVRLNEKTHASESLIKLSKRWQ